VLISTWIAIPIAYLMMQEWLSGFATHISLSIWIFIAPALVVLAISFLTVSYQTIVAAQSNPVNTLKNE
jgi:putative ABC transport system permease protein